MLDQPSLAQCLAPYRTGGELQTQVADTTLALAQAAVSISELVSKGGLAGDLAGATGATSDGDAQKALDLIANDLILAALSRCPVAQIASEENDEIQHLPGNGPLAVAVDPVDGSANIATNGAIGTIFSIRAADAGDASELGAFASTGEAQLAAGYVLYGPQTTLVLTTGSGVDVFVLERKTAAFLRTKTGIRIPRGTRDYAINASNARHWDPPVRQFVEDCLAGSSGPLGVDYNTRWYAAMIGEAHRILLGGGVFLYPGDARPGYHEGRLRLVYEAQAVAFLIEQAGGAASDGYRPIRTILPQRLHQRVPLIFGAPEEVSRIDMLHAAPADDRSVAPRVGRRGLFRS